VSERIQVTPESVKEYIDANLSGDNFHLFYGLHLLSHDRFSALMDALINGELQVEELVRLGGFSDAEADALIAESLGSWVSPAVAIPATGSDGYAYLSDELDLGWMVQDAAVAGNGIPVGRVLGVSIRVGRGGHTSIEEVDSIFATSVLPDALVGQELRIYLPSTVEEIMELSIPGADDARRQFLSDIAPGILAPLMGSGPVLSKLLTVGTRRPGLSSAPGLAQWILSDAWTVGNVRLLMHREAALRTTLGPYTRSEIDGMLDAVLASRPGYVATMNHLNSLYFKAKVAAFAAMHHFPSDVELADKASKVVDVLDALNDHRDRLRYFLIRVVEGCSGILIGTYPAS
jgi:hypothetical protein